MATVANDSNLPVSILCDTNTITVQETQSVAVWVSGPAEADQLIHLYETYKEECVRHVEATSSFILYDKAVNQVVAVRDLFGTYPLYYAQNADRLIISFSVKNIIESKQVSVAIDAQAVAAYVNWNNSGALISNQTFYKQIYSLLPAHALHYHTGQLTVTPYYQLHPGRYVSLTDEDYVRRFRTCLVESVQRAAQSVQRVATHLSGGLDSSSVYSVAQSLTNEPVHSFFIKTDTQDTLEEPFVEAVLTNQQKAGQSIDHQDVLPGETVYQDAEKQVQLIGQPSLLLLPVSTFLPVLERAQQAGCDVLLSGHGGDQITGYGFDHLDALFDQQDWASLKKAIGEYTDRRLLPGLAGGKAFENTDQKRRAYTLHFFIGKLKQQKRLVDRLRLGLMLLINFDGVLSAFTRLIRTKWRGKKETPIPALKNLIRDEWLSQHREGKTTSTSMDTTRLSADLLSASQKEHLDAVYGRLGIHYNEEIAQLQAHYSLQTAHPFLDKNLLELSLNTPLRLRFGNGSGRGVLRQAMANYLPKKVTNRIDKGEFSEYGQRAFQKLYTEFSKRTDAAHPVWTIIDKSTFDAVVTVLFNERYTIRQKNPHRFVANRVIYLAIWLDYFNTL